jgi:hypothetical protein
VPGLLTVIDVATTAGTTAATTATSVCLDYDKDYTWSNEHAAVHFDV